MRVGVLGDIHGNFEKVNTYMAGRKDVNFWLCVGDIADEYYNYFKPLRKLYWIRGNNEDWDFIEKLEKSQIEYENLHYIPNGKVLEIANLKILGLGGTFAPKFYSYRREDLPHPKERDFQKTDKRRHFVEEEVELCKKARNIDIFLTHEAPSPYFAIPNVNAGKKCINEILSSIKPKIHFFGHHHEFSVKEYVKGIKSICLDKVDTSWLLLDTENYTFKRVMDDIEW